VLLKAVGADPLAIDGFAGEWTGGAVSPTLVLKSFRHPALGEPLSGFPIETVKVSLLWASLRSDLRPNVHRGLV
jgi:hypothetical protein